MADGVPGTPSQSEPYAALAAGYDAVMDHVDYDAWADYAATLLQRYAPRAEALVELGCGTGELALRLVPLGPETLRYRGYDGSAEMVAVARAKAAAAGLELPFEVLRFGEPVPGPPADAVLLLYDGLNYLLDEPGLVGLFRSAHDALRPGGVFIVDQSTPVNSSRHAAEFEDAGETGAFAFDRHSHYDPATRLHTTRFELTLPDGTRRAETHVQRAYTLAEVERAVGQTPFEVSAVLDDFGETPATRETERAHWVLRRPSATAGG